MRETKRGARVVGEEEGRRMLKIGEVSRRSGVGVEALRFYEKGGLLDSPRARTAAIVSTARRYSTGWPSSSARRPSASRLMR